MNANKTKNGENWWGANSTAPLEGCEDHLKAAQLAGVHLLLSPGWM